jgi:hypothetical protein
MIPIGIVTRNRPVYLDATLRSLSATRLPADVPVIVYDDASDLPEARRYLDTNEEFQVEYQWPTWPRWREAGLGNLQDNPVLQGIAGLVPVIRVAEQVVGVGNAECFAIRDLFTRYPASDALILLEDDALYNVDWYERLTSQIGKAITRGGRQGIVSGYKVGGDLNWTKTVLQRFVPTVCTLVRRTFYETSRAWFARMDHAFRGGDVELCAEARRARFEIQLLVPYVCQHIGVASEVRPGLEFYDPETEAARLGRHSHPPFALAIE